MLFCESAARSGFQISFEQNSTLLVSERNVSLDPPRDIFRCMSDLPRIVSSEAITKIFSQTIKVLDICFALESVDVGHESSLPSSFAPSELRRDSLRAAR